MTALPIGRNVPVHPGDQVTVESLLQVTVGVGSVTVDLLPGVELRREGSRLVFTRDWMGSLPRLDEVKGALLARAWAVRGDRAVHRLTGALNGVLAGHPDAVASTNIGWAPVWDAPRTAGPGETAGQDPDASPHEAIGCVYWQKDGVWTRRAIDGAGIMGRAWPWSPRS